MKEHSFAPYHGVSAATLAAYTNLARHNLFLVLNDIAEKIGLPSLSDEDHLADHRVIQVLDNPKEAMMAQKVMSRLEQALPFIVRNHRHLVDFGEKRPPNALIPDARDIYQLLHSLTSTLNALRNSYTHIGQPTVMLPHELSGLLMALYNTALRIVKSRHGYSEEIFAHLRPLTRNPDYRREKRYNPKAKASMPNPQWRYRLLNEQRDWTAYGQYFFCCLFLSKQEGYELLKQITGFKQDNSTAHQATLQLFTCFHLRLPHIRIQPQYTEQILALDMLNELARCPGDLYEHLTAEGQEAYLIQPQLQDDNPDPDEDDNNLPFIRHQERFTPLAMRYLDHTKALPSLRFAVDLGDFYFAAYPKTLHEGSETQSITIRRLKKKVIRYARLNELEQSPSCKPTAWQKMERTVTEADYPHPFIVTAQPHYHLPEDNLALVDITQHPGADQYPSPQPDPDTPSRYLPPTSIAPDYCLSPHELWPLVFYHWLHTQQKQEKNSAEYLISQYRNTLNRLYDDIAAGKLYAGYAADEAALNESLYERFQYYAFNLHQASLRSSDLPEVIRRYLLADKRATPVTAPSHADRLIQRLITDTDGRLAKLKLACQKESKTNRNRPGDKLQRTIRAGHLADWLARDIMRLQPCLHHEQACLSAQQTGKATSLLFSELQARLAFYGRDKPLVPALCQRMALIDSPNPHPFLQSVLDAHPAGIVECYQSYLENKKRWLHTLQQQLSQQPEHVLSQHHWLLPKPRPQSETDIHHHIKKLKAGTLNLPRGLFAEPIKALIAGLDNPTLQQAIDQSERLNSSYILQLYMQHVRQDGYPPVYTLERHYKTIDKACDNRAGRAVSLPVTPVRMQGRYNPHDSTHPSYIARLTDWMSTENVEANLHKQHKRMPDQAELTAAQTLRKRAVNSVAKTEKRLRQIRTHDQVLFLMMEQLLALNPEHNQPLRHLKLNTLSRRTLSQTVDYSLTLHRTTIQASNICLKNIGHFRHLLKDRRLPGLLPYLDRTLSDTALRQQLEAYQHQRLRAFKLMLAFEQAIVDQYGPPPTTINMRQHASLLDHLFNQLGAGSAQDSTNKASMAVIRNAFCHNQFPSADFPRTQTHYPAALPMLQQAREHWHDDSCPSVAEYFVNLLATCYQHYLPETIQETQP